MVSGGGGRRLYPAGNGEFTASSVSAHHAVLVRVSGRHLLLEAVEVGGGVVDRLELEAYVPATLRGEGNRQRPGIGLRAQGPLCSSS